MFKNFYKFIFGFSCLLFLLPLSAEAFDSQIGGGDQALLASNGNAGNRVLLGEITLTNAANLVAENVIITIPAGLSVLNFETTLLNFITSSGNFAVSNIASTPTQISFTLDGAGTLKIQNIGVFGTDFNTVGEIFELRTLNINHGGADFTTNNFVVDTTDYPSKEVFAGATGGTAGDIFKVGDSLGYNFGANNYTARGTFTMNLTAFGGSATQDILNNPLFINVGNDDADNFSSPVTINYTNTNATQTYNTNPYKLDNQPPEFNSIDLNNFNFLTISGNKSIAGIGDTITLNMPPQTSSDALFFTANFTDIAGTIANFINQPAGAQSIVTQEVSIDNLAYSKPITFVDDAGNVFAGTNTNSIGIDLIKPIISSFNILDNNSGNTWQMGESITLTAPTESFPSGNTTFSIDMSPVGGASTNFQNISGNQQVLVRSGNLNNQDFQANFTLIDKGGNTVTGNTNLINVNNFSLLGFNDLTGGGNKLVNITNNSLENKVKLETLVFMVDGDLNNDLIPDNIINREPVVISIDNITGSPNAQLAFETTNMNISVTSGNSQNFFIENLIITPTEITFDLTSTGVEGGIFQIENLGIYGFNFGAVGEFYEQRNLNIKFRGIDEPGDTFIVDTTNYTNKINFNGATGGTAGDIFKVGDNLAFDFAPFDFSSRALFAIDLKDLTGDGRDLSINGTQSFPVEIGDDDRDNFNVFLTLYYNGTTIEQKIATKTFKIDNQPPKFSDDLNTFEFLKIPTGKLAAGISDKIDFLLPDETTNDTVFFSVDFSDVAGTVGNFQKLPLANKELFLENEGIIDELNYIKPIIFVDDAGNTLPVQNTNSIIIDLIRPNLYDAQNNISNLVFNIIGNPNPGVIGDILAVGFPSDKNKGGSDPSPDFITFDISPAVGSAGIFTQLQFDKNDPSTWPRLPIVAGSLNNVNFSVPFTLYDKALNSVSGTSDAVFIDNKPPNFNTTCGGTFTVNDIGDSNGIADINNGGRDTITFNFPDKNISGCDLNNFSIDFSLITGNPSDKLFNQDADGGNRILQLAEGNIDQTDFSLPMTISDPFGNIGNYSTGGVNIDNQIITQELINDLSSASVFFTADQEIGVSAPINVKMRAFNEDLVKIFAQIPRGTTGIELVNTVAHAWEGTDRVISGPFIRNFQKYIFTITDDAGNHITLNGSKNFFLSNDNRERRGGGGGSLSLSRLKNKNSFLRFTPNQTKQFHAKTWKEKIKLRQFQRLESLKRRLSFRRTQSRINYEKPREKIQKERDFWLARIKAMGKDKTPAKLQKSFEKLAFRKINKKVLEENRVKTSEYRVQSTLDNLKNHFKSEKRLYFSARKTGIGKSGKYMRIKR